MDIYIGSDHGGFKLKEEIKLYIKELGFKVNDLGAAEFDEYDDYSDTAIQLKQIVVKKSDLRDFRAILICGTGVGMCIASNKIPGVRAALAASPEVAYFSRLHNDINVLCLAGLRSSTESIERVTDGDYQNLIDSGMVTANINESKRIVKVFLETETEAVTNTRHRRRLDKIADMEK